MCLAIGGDPENLNIAIVNDDSPNQNCFNLTFKSPKVSKITCNFDNISCRFIHEMNEKYFIKHFYKTPDEAIEDAKRLNFKAILKFDKDFTKSTNFLINLSEENNEIDPKLLESSHMKLRLDYSDLRIAYFVKSQMHSAYQNCSEKMMVECGLPKKLENFPMNEEMIYDVGLKAFQAPAVVTL